MIKRILNWFQAAKPAPSLDDTGIQIGCHFEEVAEMLEAVEPDYFPRKYLEHLAQEYKRRNPLVMENLQSLTPQQHTSLLDALCDQIVTEVGIAHMTGYNIEAALAEVCRSNESKFENGRPVFDANGKIRKGSRYTPPNLAPFIGDRK